MDTTDIYEFGEYKRFGYTFQSEKAARFFDICLENHLKSGEDIKDFDVLSGVVYATHKFHSLAYRDSFATCDGGYVVGKEALAASEEISRANKVFHDVTPEFRRSYMMAEYLKVLYPAMEKKYNVVFVPC